MKKMKCSRCGTELEVTDRPGERVLEVICEECVPFHTFEVKEDQDERNQEGRS